MRITEIETIRIAEFPNLLWVHVHTDEGLVGLGETFFGPAAVSSYIHESVCGYLLGKDPLLIDRHSRVLLNPILGFSGSGVEMRGRVRGSRRSGPHVILGAPGVRAGLDHPARTRSRQAAYC